MRTFQMNTAAEIQDMIDSLEYMNDEDVRGLLHSLTKKRTVRCELRGEHWRVFGTEEKRNRQRMYENDVLF